MWKLRVGVIAASSVFALATGTAAWGATGGDSNAGDVWLDNAGQPAGPGHEMDPHLGCGTINLYGSGLADGSGSFTIDGWPPSGSQEVVYTGNWSYSGSGTQTIASFDAATPFYGPCAFGTSDYSTLSEWPHGGIVGIHGTNEPWLIPGAPSHGCIRMKDQDITRLWPLLGIGTPVTIT